MDNVKDDKYYIRKIIADLKLITKNTGNVTKEDLRADSVLCDSVLFRIIQISESAEKLTEGFKAEHPGVPWRAIKGMRNRIVHEYGNVDNSVVYTTVTNDIPKLLDELTNELG